MEKPLISFDYAIKYLLRNKGDYDIIEGFISALFATEGYPPIKINAILDSESNQEDKEQKKSIADLVVEDMDGNKYIVEIERALTHNFAHKACFNSSRLVIDGISGNQDYTTIKKVFHISLLYFVPPQMKKPIVHGKTIIHEIDTSHPLDLTIANQGLVMFNVQNVFPEYFFISIPLFDDVIHQEIDEWLYVAKNSEIKDDFKSAYMHKVSERLKVLKMTTDERNGYIRYMKEMVDKQVTLSAAEAKGIAIGEARGAAKRDAEIVLNLYKMGLDVPAIIKATGLTQERVETLLQTENRV